MLLKRTLGALVVGLATTGCGAGSQLAVRAHHPTQPSRSVGVQWDGRLVQGVQLPASGRTFFTWDPVRRRSPNRPGRRWGNDAVVRIVLRVAADYRRRFPAAARLGIGDLSRRHGGYFGPVHVSHQNGLDVDVYYPRVDGREREPRRPSQVDRRKSQWLVDRFVAAGAVKVFVGPRVALHGPRRIVQTLWNHDDHLHARFPRALGADRARQLARRAAGS